MKFFKKIYIFAATDYKKCLTSRLRFASIMRTSQLPKYCAHMSGVCTFKLKEKSFYDVTLALTEGLSFLVKRMCLTHHSKILRLRTFFIFFLYPHMFVFKYFTIKKQIDKIKKNSNFQYTFI